MRLRLSASVSILLLAGLMTLRATTACAAGRDAFVDLKIGSGDNWHFLGGKWTEEGGHTPAGQA